MEHRGAHRQLVWTRIFPRSDPCLFFQQPLDFGYQPNFNDFTMHVSKCQFCPLWFQSNFAPLPSGAWVLNGHGSKTSHLAFLWWITNAGRWYPWQSLGSIACYQEAPYALKGGLGTLTRDPWGGHYVSEVTVSSVAVLCEGNWVHTYFLKSVMD